MIGGPAGAAQIRTFRSEDAAAVAMVFYEAVHGIASAHYSPRQIEAWAPRVPDPERILGWAGDGRLFLVATDESDNPVAFGDLEKDGHIDHLFCCPAVSGTGTAALLCDALEKTARAWGVELLYVEASEPAKRFFLKRGFSAVHRRDFTILDVPIHNYRMEKVLPRPEHRADAHS